MDKEVNIEEVKISDSEIADDGATSASDADILDTQIAELNDKYMRALAELENMRRRAAIDTATTVRNRTISVVENFLPVMDAVDAALVHNPNDEGVGAMARAMESAFEKIGIMRIESSGQQMNPMFHNAIQVVDAPNGEAPNTIVDELQAGYMFGDTVLRPAMVVVSK